jgi:hypothetical protein
MIKDRPEEPPDCSIFTVTSECTTKVVNDFKNKAIATK